MTDIFEEVEEAHRKDKVDEAWRKYGWVVWLAGLGVVAAVAFNELMSAQRDQAQAARAGTLEDAIVALDEGDYANAITQFEAIVDGGTDLAPLAAHYLAQARLAGQGDSAAAIETLETVADAEGGPFAQVALLKAAYLESDTVSLEELETMLAPLSSSESTLGALAQELIAAKAFAVGDLQRARREYNYLRFAPNAPQGLSQRAEIALATLPRPAPEEVPAAPAPAPGTGDGDAAEAQTEPATAGEDGNVTDTPDAATNIDDQEGDQP